MSQNFLSQNVDKLAQPFAYLFSLFLPDDFSYRLAIVVVVLLAPACFFLISWLINKCRNHFQKNKELREQIVQNIIKKIAEENKKILNPIVLMETSRIEFFYTHKPLLSRKKSSVLKQQGIKPCNIATIRINKMRDIVLFSHFFIDKDDRVLALRYLIVSTDSRFIEPLMTQPGIVELIRIGKLQIHFICYDDSLLEDLRKNYRVIDSVLPFPGIAFFLQQNQQGELILKESYYPSVRL